jgi:uncharacterized protein (TIGR03118 family)
MKDILSNTTSLACLAAALSFTLPSARGQNAFLRLDLVADTPGLATNADSNLVEPWGIASSSTSPFWIANHGSGLSTAYNGSGTPQSVVVTIPPAAGSSGRSAPTGVAFNGGTSFEIATGVAARFLFATEDGTIAAWHPSLGTSAVRMVDNSASGAIYKGLAIGSTASGDFLYAANFKSATVDVFNSDFSSVALGGFTDPGLPAGFAPFNIRNLAGKLYVTYARPDASGTNDLPGAGNGIVDVFDLNGILVRRLITSGLLNSPWGLALAPSTLMGFAGNLLVGNSGDGRINAFDPDTGVLKDVLRDGDGNPLVIEGLRGLILGNGGSGGDSNTLYFTAGTAVGVHGLFGSLNQKAEPPPLLSIERTYGNVRVFWSVTATNFVLDQTTTLLSPPATNSWTQVPFPYQTNATQISVTQPVTPGSKFFRLRKP